MKLAIAEAKRIEWIERVLALFGLLLLAVTWRLWTPQRVFPRVPLIEPLARLPEPTAAWATWIALALSVLALLVIASLAHRAAMTRAGAIAAAVGFAALVLLDQHRLQAWGVHIGVSLWLAAFPAVQWRLRYLIWFTASIYIYSALGKFDAQFLHTVGQDFVRVLLEAVGWQAQQVDYRLRVWLATGFPIFELAVGVGLLFGPTRTAAAWGAAGMHVLLIGVLGPWGLGHAAGVLVWNGLLVALSVLMVLWPATSGTPLDAPVRERWRFGFAEALLACWLVLPAGERFGLVDHWLGWALYAPHSSRAEIEISAAALDRLPAEVQPFLECDHDPAGLWCLVRADRWSVATLGAPITPQQRFQLGVARELSRYVDPYQIRVELLGTADRWTGRRRQHELRGSQELEAAADDYWLNTTPCLSPLAD